MSVSFEALFRNPIPAIGGAGMVAFCFCATQAATTWKEHRESERAWRAKNEPLWVIGEGIAAETREHTLNTDRCLLKPSPEERKGCLDEQSRLSEQWRKSVKQELSAFNVRTEELSSLRRERNLDLGLWGAGMLAGIGLMLEAGRRLRRNLMREKSSVARARLRQRRPPPQL